MRKHFSSLRSQMTLLTTGTVLAVVILATVFLQQRPADV